MGGGGGGVGGGGWGSRSKGSARVLQKFYSSVSAELLL